MTFGTAGREQLANLAYVQASQQNSYQPLTANYYKYRANSTAKAQSSANISTSDIVQSSASK